MQKQLRPQHGAASMDKLKRVLILSLITQLITGIRCDCVTTFATICSTVDDVKTLGNEEWTELIVGEEMCGKRTTIGRPREHLAVETFTKSPNLRMLYLVEKVRNIEVGAFQTVGNLNYLKLYKNLIKVAALGTFSGFRHLAMLDLQHNSIENLATGCFANSSIESIDVSNNLISSIATGVVDLPGLLRLSISHNRLVHLAERCFNEDLEHLDLSYNSLSHIDLGVLNGLKNLKTFILNHNKIKAIIPIPFLKKLQILDVSSNGVQHIEDKAFTDNLDLQELYLNNNSIKYVSHTSFPTQSNLITLHLHRNLLTLLTGDLGNALPKLKHITIGGNPWACSCLTIIQTYFNMKGIQFEQCDLTHLTDGLNPVCYASGSRECVGNEHVEILKEDVSSFQSSYKCTFKPAAFN
ncbi:PREDICTED: leucine-rich repeat-containing protein 15-like [Nicrophorus vespilloides]|uniref:Leucine-rich repeat-containing protein 15-like n=1 Tax=Nicrophorus vespilloides TaxID=110193 RepID=A0ABM1N981_NICVS|nr:PREDICTED: leucine-rich repeat-containing protein 15-like [Nicrophorus vespilloides]